MSRTVLADKRWDTDDEPTRGSALPSSQVLVAKLEYRLRLVFHFKNIAFHILRELTRGWHNNESSARRVIVTLCVLNTTTSGTD